MVHCKYHKLNVLPENWSRAVWAGKTVANDSDPFKWSGSADPPKLGDKVKCYMNDLGDGVVAGYFAEHGWLGVLVKLDKNPDPLAHLFGVDLEPRKKMEG